MTVQQSIKKVFICFLLIGYLIDKNVNAKRDEMRHLEVKNFKTEVAIYTNDNITFA